MRKAIIIWVIFITVGSFLIINVAPSDTTPWPVMPPTSTPIPTPTSMSTPTPTATAIPTSTPIPTPTPWQFAVMADMQVAETWCRSLDITELVEMDLILIPGDLVDHAYNGFDLFMRCYGPILDLILPAPGNHDVYRNRTYYDAFADQCLEGRNVLLRGPREYVVLHREVAIVSLSWFGTSSAWIEKALQAAQVAEHIVVIQHRPVYSTFWPQASATHAPLFKKYEVDLVFSGHVHAFDRIEKDGVVYITTGGAGGKLRPGQRHHFIQVSLPGLTADIKYLD